MVRQADAVVLSSVFNDRRWVHVALGGRPTQYCENIDEAREALEITGAPALIMRLRDARGESAEELARHVAALAPRLSIAALVSPRERESRDALAMAHLGFVSVLVDSDVDLASKIRMLTENVRFDVRRAVVAARAADSADPSIRRCVRNAIEFGDRPRSVPEFANAVGCGTSQLNEHCARYLGIPPRALVMRGRLIATVIQLESSLAAVERVALETGFPSGPGFHNALKRWPGVDRRAVIAAGGSEWMVGLMLLRVQRASERPMRASE